MSGLRKLVAVLIILCSTITGLYLGATNIFSLSLTSDEKSYLASAIHTRFSRTFDTNMEVGPLGKVYLALTVPSDFKKYVFDIHDDMRSQHGAFPLALFEKIPAPDIHRLLIRARLAEFALYLATGFFLFWILIRLKTSIPPLELGAGFAVFYFLAPSLMVCNLLADVDGLTSFIFVLLLGNYLKVLNDNEFQAALPLSSALFGGLLFGCGIMTKSTFYLIFPLMLFSFAVCFWLQPRKDKKSLVIHWLVVISMAAATVLLILSLDKYGRLAHSWGRPSYLDYANNLHASLKSGFLMNGIVWLANHHLFPAKILLNLEFNRYIILGLPHGGQLMGSFFERQTLVRLMEFIFLKVTWTELILFLALPISFLVFIRRKQNVDRRLLFILLVSSGILGGMSFSEVNLAIRYYLPVMLAGILALALIGRETSLRKVGFFILSGIFCAQMLFLFSSAGLAQDLLSISAPWISYFGGGLGNLSVIEDQGQESDWLRSLTALSPTPAVFLSNSVAVRNYHPAPLPELNRSCTGDEKISIVTSAEMALNNPYLVKLYAGTAEAGERVGQTGIIYTLKCSDWIALQDRLKIDAPSPLKQGYFALVACEPVDSYPETIFPDFPVPKFICADHPCEESPAMILEASQGNAWIRIFGSNRQLTAISVPDLGSKLRKTGSRVNLKEQKCTSRFI